MPRVCPALVFLPVLLAATSLSARPQVVSGVLTAPRAGEPEIIARTWLATRPPLLGGVDPGSLRSVGLHQLRDGALVKLVQTVGGLDIVGGEVAVRLDTEGRVRWARAGAVTIPAGFSTTPVLGAKNAIARVLEQLGRAADRPLDPALHARLVVYAGPALPGPRLAWWVVLPADPLRLATMAAHVDATTGQLLSLENLARRAAGHLANVYQFNPRATPVEIEAPLTDLSADATQLFGPDVHVSNCINEGKCTEFDSGMGKFKLPFCTVKPVAATNADGTFLDIQRPASDLDPEDSFAEVQMYYHVAKAYSAFRTLLGDASFVLNAHPLTAVVNVRIPDGFLLCSGDTAPPGSQLAPLDNAAFMPAGTLGGYPPEDSIVFGQGSAIDFSYDGDVVYHEFTHAVMATVSSLGSAIPDPLGIDLSPGAMQEGYADYFSSTITGDAEVGEYAGAGFGTNVASGAIRSLDNSNVCPLDLSGEPHIDSLVWSGALWQARLALAAEERPVFDAAVLVAVRSLTMADNFASGAATTVAEVKTSLGQAAADVLAAKMSERGLDSCGDRTVVLAEGDTHAALLLAGTDQAPIPLVPSPLQFRIEVPEDSDAIGVEFARLETMGTPAPKLLVKPGAEPIQWAWTYSGATNDATAVADVEFATSGSGKGAGTVHGSFPAGTYQLMLANAGDSAFLHELSFGHQAATLSPDAGTEIDAGSIQPGDKGGCGCLVGGALRHGSSALLVLGLALGGLCRRRRFATRS